MYLHVIFGEADHLLKHNTQAWVWEHWQRLKHGVSSTRECTCCWSAWKSTCIISPNKMRSRGWEWVVDVAIDCLLANTNYIGELHESSLLLSIYRSEVERLWWWKYIETAYVSCSENLFVDSLRNTVEFQYLKSWLRSSYQGTRLV